MPVRSRPSSESLASTENASTISTNFFSDIVQSQGDGVSLAARCLPRELPTTDGRATCTLVEATSGPDCNCNAPGRAAAPAGAASMALQRLELSGSCGGPSDTACSDLCLCEIVQESGAALQSCQNSLDTGGFDGWCYVDPPQGLGNPELTKNCPATDRQLVRLAPANAPRTVVIGCYGQRDAGQQPSANAKPAALGEPCVPQEEYRTAFSGFSATEVNVETRSPSCTSGICLAHNFEGRVSCPYGQHDGSVPPCLTPAGDPVTVPVRPQIVDRPPEDAVVCSCRCDGPEGEGPFCGCPSGMECVELIKDIGVGRKDVAGSYCIRAGTHVEDPTVLASQPRCDASVMSCGPADGGL